MAILFIMLFVALLIALSRKKQQRLVYESLNRTAKQLYTTIYKGNLEDRPRIVLDREIPRWVQSQPMKKLKNIRCYLGREISQLQPADWDGYMFNTILEKSSDLFFFLDEHGDLTIYSAKSNELEGIQDAGKAVQHTRFQYPFTLRTFFHDMFQNIILHTRQDDRYYGYGQLRVINLLRSFQASAGMCMKSPRECCNDQWSKLTVFARLAAHFRWQEDQRKHTWIDIHRGFPIIEFDLVRVEREGVFKKKGVVINDLFLHLVSEVTRLIDTEPQYRSFSESMYDMRAACFTYSYGEVYIVKYTGITDEFANRLYVEFANIPPRDLLYCELLSMKLHYERNN